MRISDMNWMDVEKRVAEDDRCILPIGSTEQHAQLSLSVDSILAERVSLEAAEPLDIPVFPVMPYGLAPYFAAYPGTVTLRVETLVSVIRDVVASLERSGFRRILVVNGHGGNQPAGAVANEMMLDYPHVSIKFHNWWNAPKVWAKVQAVDPSGSHANWMENYPWTRLAHAPAPRPEAPKPAPDMVALKAAAPEIARDILGDGAFGGDYQKADEIMLEIWKTGVEEVRNALEGPWPIRS
ncbi:creatininase family protein [Rhizobiales bacterium]|uniref:creatininase family protein n=1 Tax=Hongsoonwoonella zoysiae TaxID=2821844 RepID=UPI001560E3B6|nr:creatininase family protein [Hongsoonwoonella zoysiae]NRG16280.1 creatininase family protein [Hongsoonwoonella zoysiae]